MHGFWPFDILLPVPARPDEQAGSPAWQRRLFFLFCSVNDPDPISVAEFVEAYCDNRRPPDAIYLIAPQTERAAIERVLESTEFQGRAKGATRYSAPPATDCLLFDANGRVVNRANQEPQDLDIEAVRRRGLTHLVKTLEVRLEAPPSHHFVVPSESHAQQFFRVGNAMADGAAIDFIAFCCLPFFADRDVKHVYCDTGAISPVVYAVNALRNRLGGPKLSVVCTSSFKSYNGAKDFGFPVGMQNSLVLISLSTTGSLAPFIRRHHPAISDSDILTLFMLHKPTNSTRFVCDLRKDEDNPEGFEPVDTHREEGCPLCAQGSTRILISTEQFLPGHGHTEQVLIRARHSPEGLTRFLGQFVGTRLIRAHYRLQDNARAVSHATAEVFFDLERLFEDEKLLDDGAIQASLLRAAALPELDYSVDENISKEMWQVLDFIFRARAIDAGEAYREFLVALALERLRLRTADLERLLEDHGKKAEDAIDLLLWKRIESILEQWKRQEQQSSSENVSETPP